MGKPVRILGIAGFALRRLHRAVGEDEPRLVGAEHVRDVGRVRMEGRLLAHLHVVELNADALIFEEHLHARHHHRAVLTPGRDLRSRNEQAEGRKDYRTSQVNQLPPP